MNRSGQAVVTAAGYYKVPLSDLLVVSDDMAIEPGRIRIRKKGSSGGHNGLADIIEKLGSDEFPRLRVGIGSSGRANSVDFVLSRPDEQDRKLIEAAINDAVKAILCWLEYGTEMAMNRFNAAAKEDE